MGGRGEGAPQGVARRADRGGARGLREAPPAPALADTFDEGEHRIDEGVRRGLRFGREGQLAAEGAVSLFYTFSRRTFAELVKAGREWEEETAMPSRRRRVPLDDERGLIDRPRR